MVLCNPPFGAETVERRAEILKAYDLGHVWTSHGNGGWKKTQEIAKGQQLGILFIERCWKMLRDGGRLAIILPEGYLATAAHTYVRQWILEHFVIRSLVELPRRIFVKSGADLRSNIMVAEKRNPSERVRPYPIHASMVRRVGYKLGGDFKPLPLQDKATGLPIRDSANQIVLDSDFRRVLREFSETPKKPSAKWNGATVTDIIAHESLDMKARRLVPRALENIRDLKKSGAILLSQIASVLEDTIDLLEDVGASEFRRVVEGQDIRAIEGIVVPHFPERCWSISERKQRKVYQLQYGDVIVGLVRPERRNIGILLDEDTDVVGSPDGLAVVRVNDDCKEDYPTEWLFATLRSEQIRLQLWTESGGTSYGKLDTDQIRQVLIPTGSKASRTEIATRVRLWIESVRANSKSWAEIGIEGDRRPILNSPLTGLFDEAGAEFAESGEGEDSGNERDIEVARNRLAEIEKHPERLIQGDALRKRLSGIKS